MKIRSRTASAVLASAGLVGAALVAVAAPAAAAAPPYEPDPNALGQIVFYDAAGHAKTSGTLSDAPFAAYGVTTADDPQTANTTATLFAYTPVSGVNPLNWSGEQLSSTTTFPVTAAGAPSAVTSAGAHRPVISLTDKDLKLSQYVTDVPNTDTASDGYAGVYQLRLVTDNNDPKYWVADIQVTGTTWTLVYPGNATPPPPPTPDTSSLSISRNATIAYGATTVSSTVVKDSTKNTVLSGKTVSLYSRATPTGAARLVGTAVTNSSGVAAKTVKPTGRTYYFWSYGGDATHKPASSPLQAVQVAQVVSARSTKRMVSHSVAFKIYGTVAPAAVGARVSLQRLIGTRWKTIAVGVEKRQKLPNGVTTVGYVFTEKLARATYRFRVVRAATATLLGANSATVTVKVT